MKTIVSSSGFAGSCRPAKAVRARRVYLAALVSFFASFSAASARADAWSDGLYLKVFGGLHGLADGDINQGATTGEASYGGGQLFGAGVGKTFTQNWAVEAEFFYRSNDLDSVSAGNLAASTDGDFASTNLMFNGVYTFTQADGSGLWGKFTPFVGAGLGFLQEADVDAKISGVEQEYDDTWIFAAQVFAGVSYAVGERWAVYLETRYHYAGELELESSAGNLPVKADYDGLSGLVGVRYHF
jgi:opacity protein-like surface antigen